MSDATFSVVTSVYTVGGLLGSVVANVVMDRWGRKGACLASAFIMAVGAGFMSVAASLSPLVIGRLVAMLNICSHRSFLKCFAERGLEKNRSGSEAEKWNVTRT